MVNKNVAGHNKDIIKLKEVYKAFYIIYLCHLLFNQFNRLLFVKVGNVVKRITLLQRIFLMHKTSSL